MKRLDVGIYEAQIKTLMALKPVLLFQKLNRLGWYAEALHDWTGSLPLPVNGTLLEAGCAAGALSEHLAAQGFAVTGVDDSAAMVAAASADGRHGAGYQQASLLELPFADGAFDGVIAASVINIISDQERAVSEMARVCRPGGVVSFLVPAEGFGDEEMEVLEQSLGLTGFSAAALRSWHRLAPKMAVEAAASLCRAAGLGRVKSASHLGGMLFSFQATR